MTAFREVNRGPKVQPVKLPATVGGWNTRDALDAMEPTDAVVLDNLIPQEGAVVSRKGFEAHCNTGEAMTIKTLAEYKAGVNNKLIAGVNGKLVDVTTLTPTTLGTGFTEDEWRTINFSDRIFFFNGTDAPRDWDGSTLTATAWTGSGLTISNLTGGLAHQKRLLLIEKNTANFWYGSVDAVSGTLNKFSLSTVGNRGGTLLAIGKITSDGGDGVNDHVAFFMSSGEIIVYQGSDPSSGTNWSLVGVFYTGRLIARSAVSQLGSDCVFVGTDGFVALTQILPFGRNVSDRQTMSDKISDAARYATQSYEGQAGWQTILYPREDLLIFNVPRTPTSFHQYVMNTATGGWCRFRNMNGRCWSLLNDALYFGGTDGIVYKALSGNTDNGSAIPCDVQTAWTYLGSAGTKKRFTMARPIFRSTVSPAVQLNLGFDFQASINTGLLLVTPAEPSAVWDDAVWDQATWGGGYEAYNNWQLTTGWGDAVSMRLRFSNSTDPVEWLSTTYALMQGGLL